jgi:hypothetical protein
MEGVGCIGKCGIQVYLVQSFVAQSIWNENRMPDKTINPPWLRCFLSTQESWVRAKLLTAYIAGI